MNCPNYEELKKMLDVDIEKIEKSDSLSDEERFMLFKRIIASYTGIIQNLYAGLHEHWRPKGYEAINYGALKNKPEEINENLQFLLGKLTLAKAGFGLVSMEPASIPSANKINIQNNFTPSISFERACSEIENVNSLTDEQKKEAISKIKEIEKATQHSKTDKTRWEKIKPILIWLGNSSFELSKVILPLIVK